MVVKIQHLLLSPLVVFTIPAAAVLGQPLALTIVVAAVGGTGMILKKRVLAVTGSIILLSLIIGGKAAANLIRAASPDSALLLAQFTAVLVCLEASHVILSFENEYSKLKQKHDDLSEVFRTHLQLWLRNQLMSLGKLASVSLGLSIVLLPLAGITSISSNELVFSATLALLAVIFLMLLVTHRREPEDD